MTAALVAGLTLHLFLYLIAYRTINKQLQKKYMNALISRCYIKHKVLTYLEHRKEQLHHTRGRRASSNVASFWAN